MHTLSAAATNVKSPATIRALAEFGRVVLDCDGTRAECSVDDAITEVRRTGRTLANILLVDYDPAKRAEGPRSRQCQQVVDALQAGLPA